MARRGHIRQRITRILGETVAANLGFTTRDRLKLAITGSLGLVLLGLFSPLLVSKESNGKFEPKSYSVEEWYVDGPSGPEIVLNGVILDPDGSLSNNASLSATTLPSDTYGATVEVLESGNGRFKIQTNGMNVVYLRSSTEGRKLLGSVTLGPEQIRRNAEQDIVVQLRPAKEIQVSVSNTNKQDGRCVFVASSYAMSQSADADSQGKAKFSIYEDSDVSQIVCWTESKRIGFKELRGERGLSTDEVDTPIELLGCEPVTVLVQEADGAAVSGAKIEAFVSGKIRFSTPELLTVHTDSTGTATFDFIPAMDGLRIQLKVDGVEVPYQPLTKRVIAITKPSKPDDNQEVFNGHVDLPAGCPGGLYLRGGSFENPIDGRTTPIFARCDRDGNFKAKATPGYTYELSLNDGYWVSPCWSGILIATDDKPSIPFKLEGRIGARVDVKVTGGKDNLAVPSRYVQMQSPMTFSWIENGAKQHGGGGCRWTLASGENGMATTYAMPGELKAYCFSGKAYIEKVIQVVDGQPNHVELHFENFGDQNVVGRLVGAAEAIANASIAVTQADSSAVEKPMQLKSSTDGKFEVKTSSNQAVAYATSQDKRFVGTSLFTTSSGEVEVQMELSGSVSGQVLDGDGNPVVNGDIVMSAKVPNPKYESGQILVSQEIIVQRFEAKTDQSGNFNIATVPAKVALSLWLSTGPSTGRLLDQISLEPGEDRSTVYPDTSRRDVSFESRYSEILGDTKLSHTRALIVISGRGEQAKRFSVEHALSYDEHRDVLWYLTALFDMTTLPTMPDRQAVFNRHAWPTPEENSLWMLVMNDKDEELGRIHLNVADQARYDESLAAFERFIRDHRVDQLNAETLFEQALAEAVQTDRTVWLSVGQTRCNPCFTLARWQDQHLAMLTKAFVILKIDEIRDLHGADLAKQLKASGGIPWHVMLAPDGQPIINSESPVLGNIGSPDRSRNSMEHFREMLQKGARGKLTDEEIETLVDSVPD